MSRYKKYVVPRLAKTGPRGGKHYQYAKDTPTSLQRTHKAICDVILANPTATYVQIANALGMSQYTVANLIHNDAFKEYLTTRSALLFDPAIRSSFEKTVDSLFNLSAEILHRELIDKPTFTKAARVLGELGRTKGLMAKARPNVTAVQINFQGELDAARQRAASVGRVIESRPGPNTE